MLLKIMPWKVCYPTMHVKPDMDSFLPQNSPKNRRTYFQKGPKMHPISVVSFQLNF